ncbi:MAG: poly-gamma-glutamate biosynthesis protein PgsC [Candidatus Zixiibacteriota bacterium]
MLWVAVGTGLVISFIFAETIGLAAGGLVVPGYIAMFLDRPLMILGTLVVAFVSYLFIKIIARYAILYGRRRLILAILFGFVFSVLFRTFGGTFTMSNLFLPIGYVIPGLLAYWMDKQGIVDTLSTLFIASVVVRLIVILIAQGNPHVLAI